MKPPVPLAVALTLATVSFAPHASHAAAQSPSPPATRNAPLDLVGPEPPVTFVASGDRAPDVSWDAPNGRSVRLSDLRPEAVLLVIAPDEAGLVSLQRERADLLDLGVLPIAVLDRGAHAAAHLASRLKLEYAVVPDPRSVIAEQFNALDPETTHAAPAWVVLDGRGVVRGVDRGALPTSGWARLAATALALPLPGATLPTSAQ